MTFTYSSLDDVNYMIAQMGINVMTIGNSFRLGDMGTAECQKCGGVFLHVYGHSHPDHICQRYECGGIIRCGMDACEDRVEFALQLEIMHEDSMPQSKPGRRR